jgi:hypothetical protein
MLADHTPLPIVSAGRTGLTVSGLCRRNNAAGIEYLLTLDCKHIANARELPRIYRLLDERGFGQLLICTPAEFLGGDENDDDKPTS